VDRKQITVALTRRGILLAGAAPFVAGWGASAQAVPTRIALVIGNSNYDPIPPIHNAESDAQKIASKLSELGFDVTMKSDLNGVALSNAIKTFGECLRNAGPNAVSFVFYSGHAAQDAARVNYLLPIDAKARNPDELRDEGAPIQNLLDDMDAANNDVNVLVLDACRDWLGGDRSADMPRGLHDMGRHGSVFIAFATSPDTTADDGGGGDSPYTTRLLEALSKQANDPLALLFDDVDARVYSDTDKAQAPEYMNGLARAPRWRLLGPSGPIVASVSPPKNNFVVSEYLNTLNRDKLIAFTHGNVSFTETLLARRDLLAQYEINSPIRLAYFLATIAHETGYFRYSFENFNYSASALATMFPTRFSSLSQAQSYEHHPERIANLIYANRMGNGDESSGDGWRFRGRGYFMITGRGNYSRIGQRIGVDLISSPDLMNDPETGLAAAAEIWSESHLNGLADNDDLVGLTRRFIGGVLSGLPRRRIILEEAKQAVGVN
jgi:putative chitinase